MTIVVLLASVAALASVLLLQYGENVAPCPLCLYQRWPYYVAIPLTAGSLLALQRRSRSALARLLMTVAGISFLIGGGVAFYHVGIEQHWWAGTSACGSSVGQDATSVEELRAALMDAPVARCDEVAWSLFGLSLASYNVVLSLVLAALSFAASWRRGKI